MPARLSALALAASLFVAAGSGVRAEPVPSADAAAIQAIIASQIEAFRADDGATAYSFASPGIQTLFPNVSQFMSMVKRGYAPVYRPRAYSFQPARTDNGVTIQDVSVTGPKGQLWTARYTLEKQPDGSWRIAGCQLVRFRGADV